MLTEERLERLGLDGAWRECAREAGAELARVGRVLSEARGQYVVGGTAGDAVAVMGGRTREAMVRGMGERPAVGDWVVLRDEASDDAPRVIEGVLPRRTVIRRKVAGRGTREQVLASNVDVVLVVCALGRDVNERRIERFTALALGGGARPLVVLNKADAVDDPAPWIERAAGAAPGIQIVVVSALTGLGVERLDSALVAGRTVALLGTSGAGKSTLVNRWLGAEAQGTGAVGGDGKGRHTTTGRELFVLPSGAMVIDTPGLREVAITARDEGVDDTFEEVVALSAACRFSDCRHGDEPGCAVGAAVAAGTLDAARLDSWRRLAREQRVLEARADPAAAASQRAEARRWSKALKKRPREKWRPS